LLAALLLFTAACAKKEEEKAEPLVPVQVTTVTTGDIRRLVEADAVLFPVNQGSVIPKITAPIAKFYVNRGDHVTQG